MEDTRKYGWVPDVPDHRDHIYSSGIPLFAEDLPRKVDLTADMPEPYNQYSLGSCTGNAIAAAVAYVRKREPDLPDWNPSRLFIYYNERAMEGTIDIDAGAQIRDGIKSVASDGSCPEDLWPYDIPKFRDRPNQEAYTEAANHPAVSYERVIPSLINLKACLASGYPIVFGFSVYESFEGPDVARTGLAQMPNPNERLMGGHAVICCGYDDDDRRFLVQNSWGSGWGRNGRFTMPYEYLTHPGLSDDFWVVKLVR
jgi:hypothetical protein